MSLLGRVVETALDLDDLTPRRLRRPVASALIAVALLAPAAFQEGVTAYATARAERTAAWFHRVFVVPLIDGIGEQNPLPSVPPAVRQPAAG